MGVKVDYKAAMQEARQQALRIERALLNRLIQAGEEFVIDVRLKANVDPSAFPTKGGSGGAGIYQDQTGNLKNSIGYIIYKDGIVEKENFADFGGEGISAAKEAISKVPKKAGYVLIGVAGMNYASYLESLGYNVLTSQSIVLFQNLEKYLKRLETKTGTDFPLFEQGRTSFI